MNLRKSYVLYRREFWWTSGRSQEWDRARLTRLVGGRLSSVDKPGGFEWTTISGRGIVRGAEDVGGRPARSAARMLPDHVGPARAVHLSFIIILLEMVPDRRVKNHNATCRGCCTVFVMRHSWCQQRQRWCSAVVFKGDCGDKWGLPSANGGDGSCRSVLQEGLMSLCRKWRWSHVVNRRSCGRLVLGFRGIHLLAIRYSF